MAAVSRVNSVQPGEATAVMNITAAEEPAMFVVVQCA